MNILVLRPLWFGCLCRYDQNCPAPPLLYTMQFCVGKTPAPFCCSEPGDISVNRSFGDSLKTAMAMTHLEQVPVVEVTRIELSITSFLRNCQWPEAPGTGLGLLAMFVCEKRLLTVLTRKYQNLWYVTIDHILSFENHKTLDQKVAIFNVNIYCLRMRFKINRNRF